MAIHATWVHGNALTAESPEILSQVGHLGWGADMLVFPGKECWFHIPLPTPVLVAGARAKLQRVFFMFFTSEGSIRDVHVYDGSQLIREFPDLMSKGEHRFELDDLNTFEMGEPHSVDWGIGISVRFVGGIGFDSQIPPPRLIVASAGADYEI